MMSQKLNLLTYGIIWHIKKDKKMKNVHFRKISLLVQIGIEITLCSNDSI